MPISCEWFPEKLWCEPSDYSTIQLSCLHADWRYVANLQVELTESTMSKLHQMVVDRLEEYQNHSMISPPFESHTETSFMAKAGERTYRWGLWCM